MKKLIKAFKASKKPAHVQEGMTLTDDMEREWIKARYYKPV